MSTNRSPWAKAPDVPQERQPARGTKTLISTKITADGGFTFDCNGASPTQVIRFTAAVIDAAIRSTKMPKALVLASLFTLTDASDVDDLKEEN